MEANKDYYAIRKKDKAKYQRLLDGNKIYYEINKVKVISRQRIYQEKNKEKIKYYRKDCYVMIKKDKVQYQIVLARRRTYYEQNKSKVLAQIRNYQEKNKEKISSSRKDYYLRNLKRILDHQSEYHKKHYKPYGFPGSSIKSICCFSETHFTKFKNRICLACNSIINIVIVKSSLPKHSTRLEKIKVIRITPQNREGILLCPVN